MLDEHQFLTGLATQWALIKTYSIARGTRLLVRTRQIGSPACVGRRAEDTGVFLAELIAGDMDSTRWMTALSKVNWLHSRYKEHISNGEMISTLAFFVLEPIKFINAYGWRRLTPLEEVARFVFWREIGLRMGMQNLPDTLEELKVWQEKYEQKEQRWSRDNEICTENTMALFLRNAPRFTHGFMYAFAASLMEPRCRAALGWSDPPRWLERCILSTLKLRGLFIRYCFLPRLTGIPQLPKQDASGRMYRDMYMFEPWYMAQDRWTRFKVWFGSGGRLEAGGRWGSQGYRLEEVGPQGLVKASGEATLRQAERMREYVRGKAEGKGKGMEGCPFRNAGELRWVEE